MLVSSTDVRSRHESAAVADAKPTAYHLSRGRMEIRRVESRIDRPQPCYSVAWLQWRVATLGVLHSCTMAVGVQVYLALYDNTLAQRIGRNRPWI